MNVRRALLAVALQITITAVVTSKVLLWPMVLPDLPNRSALPGGLGVTPQMTFGIIAAFFAGWWGASGLTHRRLEQGLLIGSLVALFAALLTLVEGDTGELTAAMLLYVVATVVGAAVASLQPRIRRALVAAAFGVVGRVILVMILALLFGGVLTKTQGQLGEAEVGVIQSYTLGSRLVVGLIAAFLAGWWGARGLRDGAVKQGVLIGVLMVVYSWIGVVLLGGRADWLSLMLLLLDGGIAVVGAAFARSRHRLVPT